MAVVDKNKLLGKAEKGGDLMVRPTTSLVGSPGGKITETSDEKDVVYTISTKLVKVDKFLKGNLEAEKVQQKKEQKQKEDELRAEQEKDTEKPDDKKDEKETPKSLIPKLSFLDGIKKFLGDVLMGWLVFRLIKFLPKIVSFLKPAAAFVDWILKWGGKLLDGLITLVDWGYKAVEGTRSLMGNLFGEKGVEAFDGITGTLNTVFNLISAIGLAALAFTNEWGNQDQQERRNRNRNRSNQRNLEIENRRRTRFNDPDYRARVNERYRRRYGSDIPETQIPKPRVVDQPRKPNLFERIQRSVTPDTPSTPSTPKKPRSNFFDGWGKKIRSATDTITTGISDTTKWAVEGTTSNLRKASNWIDDVGDSVYRNTIGKLDEQLKKFDPGTILKNLQKGDGVINKAARGLGGFLDSPLTRKILGAAPFLGDAVVFLMDLLSGKHWVRAILRTVGAFGVDAGFYALLGLTGIAAPFSAGSSLALSAALVAAYMAADAAAGAALGNDGIGQFLGDFVADKLGVPKKAGETGGGAWESLFGSGGKINDSKGSVEKLIEGVELSEKQKEAISRVGGGLGDPDVLKGKSEDKNKISKKFEMKGKTYDLSEAQGGLSNEDYLALSNKDRGILDRRMRMYASQNTGNVENILPLDVNSVSKKASNVSTSASYEEGAEETIVVESGDQQSDTIEADSNGSLTAVIVSGGGGNNDEVGDLLYKGG